MPNMNSKQMKKLMKKAGIKMKELPVKKITFEFDEKEWEFTDVQVTQMTMGGQKTFQVTGDYMEKKKGFPEEDVKMVAEKAGVSMENAENALRDTDGDIAEAIMNLSKNE